MGDLVEGDDGLPAEKVGVWAKDKHNYLCRYVDISRGVRAKYLGSGKAGASYVDLFCGPGRGLIEETGEWIDGSAVAAWKMSCTGGSPFSQIIIGDADPVRLRACQARLEALGAPVISTVGPAKTTAFFALQRSPYHGLTFVFLDPYNLRSLDFSVFETLARLKRVDILVHVSTMDLQRNLRSYTAAEDSSFDAFAPGWRQTVRLDQSSEAIRSAVFNHWRDLVDRTGVGASKDVRLITGQRGQRLYWLLLAGRHELAHKFWKAASNAKGQGVLDL